MDRIIKTTSLSSDVETYGLSEGNAWIWFAFTDKDIRDATNNDETYKALMEIEYTNYEASDEKETCKNLKTIAENNSRLITDGDGGMDSFRFTREINNLTFVDGLAEDKGGLIQMHYSLIDPNTHKHYRKVTQMKPSLRAEFEKLATSIDNLFNTVHQMAKDAVREKGL